MSQLALLRLLQLADPALPVGGFSHSAGLETYVQMGVVHNSHTAKQFLVQQLSRNLQFTDAAFVSLAYDAMVEKDWNELNRLETECSALKIPRESREASRKLGGRLLKLFASICSSDWLDRYLYAVDSRELAGNYPLVFGSCAATLQIKKEEALSAFYYSAASGMVTNCVKLIPLGQQQGQALLFSIQPLIAELVPQSLQPNRELIGWCCTGFDIRSMQHERLYSRLYMS
jgi:urease accessory protein